VLEAVGYFSMPGDLDLLLLPSPSGGVTEFKDTGNVPFHKFPIELRRVAKEKENPLNSGKRKVKGQGKEIQGSLSHFKNNFEKNPRNPTNIGRPRSYTTDDAVPSQINSQFSPL
jgi:hypothetical protein